jgi:hypothetical protein
VFVIAVLINVDERNSRVARERTWCWPSISVRILVRPTEYLKQYV